MRRDAADLQILQAHLQPEHHGRIQIGVSEPPQLVHAVKIPRRLDIVGHIQDLFERGHIGLAGRVPADGIFYLKWYAETIPGHGSAGFGVQELGVGRFDRIVYDTIFIRQ